MPITDSSQAVVAKVDFIVSGMYQHYSIARPLNKGLMLENCVALEGAYSKSKICCFFPIADQMACSFEVI
jgi:hypothetical protein